MGNGKMVFAESGFRQLSRDEIAFGYFNLLFLADSL